MAPTGFLPELKNPNYPCDTGRPQAVGEYLATRNFLDHGECIVGLTPASPSGRNAIWRVATSRRSFVVKQFRPWPANGSAAPGEEERFRAECQFYRTARVADNLGGALPSVLHQDCRTGCMILEDVGGGEPADRSITPADATALAWFLIALHHHSQSVPADARYQNREVVGWQMTHLFHQSRTPRSNSGRWLARFAASSEHARHALEDARGALEKIGTSLVHGDFTASNWVRAADGRLRVVDAEFSFFGPPEFDAGALLASLLHTGAGEDVLAAAVQVISRGCMRYHPRLTAAFTAVHLCQMLERPGTASTALRGSAALAVVRRVARAVELGSLGGLLRKPAG